MSTESQHGDACECPIHAPEAHAEREECLDEHAATALVCSRPAGHDGPHGACSETEHPAMVWPEDGGEQA